MKTAIEKGIELLDKEIKFITVHDSQEDKYYQAGLKHAYNIFKDNLGTEKKQIIEAYSEGMGHYGDANNRSEADKYYNETFKK